MIAYIEAKQYLKTIGVINWFSNRGELKIRSMKKIVDFMKAVFAGHSADLNTTNNCSKINFWCPTGMNPIKNN